MQCTHYDAKDYTNVHTNDYMEDYTNDYRNNQMNENTNDSKHDDTKASLARCCARLELTPNASAAEGHLRRQGPPTSGH